MVTESRIQLRFWLLFGIQVAGALALLWEGLPVYRHLLSSPSSEAPPVAITTACVSIVVMQVAYWFALRLQSKITFRRHVVLSHLLLWIGELSYFFPHALAALCLFDRLQEMEERRFFPERLALLVALLFAMYCFKLQLERLAEAINESPTGNAESNRQTE